MSRLLFIFTHRIARPICASCLAFACAHSSWAAAPDFIQHAKLPARAKLNTGETLFREVPVSQSGVAFQLQLPDMQAHVQEFPHLSVMGGICTGDAYASRVLFSGWGTEDTHADESNLRYGFGDWIWGTVGNSGFNWTAVGNVDPDLTVVASSGSSDVLLEILDPNRSVEANYRLWNVTTKEGDTYSGRPEAETQTTVEILDVAGQNT
ncbi:hypothetical protein GC207_02245 [bacterium]|nr:hypothetical protein [bacterium]